MQEFWRLFIEKASISYLISHLPPIYHHTKTLETKPFQHASGSMAANLKKKKIFTASEVYLNSQGICFIMVFDIYKPITATNNTFTMLTP